MIKPFLVMIGIVLMMVAAVAVHYVTFDERRIAAHVSSVAEAVQMTQPSLSVSFYESRVLVFQKPDNIAYPEMVSMERMDFVYAR